MFAPCNALLRGLKPQPRFLQRGFCRAKSIAARPTHNTIHHPYSLISGGGGGPPRGGARKATGSADGPDGDKQSGFLGLLGAYTQWCNTSPFIAKGLTCAVLNGLGDAFSQIVIEHTESFDLKRFATFSILGALFVAPALHTWYLNLSKLIPQSGNVGAISRLAADQLGFAPIFTAAFISILLTAEGQMENVPAKLKQDWWTVVKSNWALWVPAQYINFRFVPQPLQVLAANITALFWNVYLSYATHTKVEA